MKQTSILVFALLLASSAHAADNCISSVLLRQNATDGYSPETAFSSTTNTAIYYDYKSPGTSLVDTTLAGCQAFSTGLPNEFIFTSFAACCIAITDADWFNNNTCATVSGCDGRDDDAALTATDRNVIAVGATTTAATYASLFVVDTVAFDTGLVRYEYDNSVGSLHAVFNMTRPSIQSGSCTGALCDLVVGVVQPNFDATGATDGIYGDTAGVAGGATQSLVAGYKIVAAQQASAPTSGLASNYTFPIADVDRYIPATRPPDGTTVISGPITITGLLGSDPIWLAYVPVFNFSGSGCAAGTACTSAQIAALDAIGALSNSLALRIASPASQPIGPNPVKFVSFTGKWKGSKVTLTWVTASEIDTAGFDLYRWNMMMKPGEAWEKVNTAVIPSLSQGGSGATYTYVDKPNVSGQTVRYMLKEVPLSNAPAATIETTVTKGKKN